MKFYLSGPMRGIDHFNFPAFDAAAEAGRAKGFEVISPADLDRQMGHTGDGLLDIINTPVNMRMFANNDLKAILALRAEDGDGIALLPGWEGSTGAIAELLVARWVGLKVVDATTWEPFTGEELFKVDLTPALVKLRDYMGDKDSAKWYEAFQWPDPEL